VALASAIAIAIAIALAAPACSGSNDDATITPSTLASTCGQICNNVVAQCSIGTTAYSNCTNACTTLLLAPETCITQFAGYLTCLTGATSITCVSDGQTTTFAITPDSCASEQSSYETCNSSASPGGAACIALSSSSTACSMNAGEGLTTTGTSEFCVGTPDNCTPTSSANPLDIGTYCCN
jgi:hypothetical protein